MVGEDKLDAETYPVNDYCRDIVIDVKRSIRNRQIKKNNQVLVNE